MFKNINQKSNRWGQEEQENFSLDLLTKKDQQIRRLQAELEQQKRRADNAVKMLESYKSMQQQSEQTSQGLRGEITRRIKAQDQVKKLKKKNKQLQDGIHQYLKLLQIQISQKQKKLLQNSQLE